MSVPILSIVPVMGYLCCSEDENLVPLMNLIAVPLTRIEVQAEGNYCLDCWQIKPIIIFNPLCLLCYPIILSCSFFPSKNELSRISVILSAITFFVKLGGCDMSHLCLILTHDPRIGVLMK